MKVLLIGSGGREHAIAIALNKSPLLTQLYIAPGNPGMNALGTCLDIKATDINTLKDFAIEKQIDLTFVGPEDPLAAGIVDVFESEQLSIIGPNQYLAQLESSKTWSKQLMQDAGIPTARYQAFRDPESALNYLKTECSLPIVIKAAGLAAGKGVTVAQNLSEAVAAIQDCFVNKKFGNAGEEVVIEDFLKGEEASIFAFSDGKTILPMIAAQDHKALLEGDKGPNTGGMGAYAPAPLVTDTVYKRVIEQVFQPLQTYFDKHKLCYKGIIYAGLMIDEDGQPSVVEFNARFGDPETQVVLPLLENDLLQIFKAIADQNLKDILLKWKNQSSVCVVKVAKGYPGSYEKSKEITGLNTPLNPDSHIVFAGVREEDGKLLSNGGRVLALVTTKSTLSESINQVYQEVTKIHFEGACFRKDIGFKASENA